jgi:hypothetical protein
MCVVPLYQRNPICPIAKICPHVSPSQMGLQRQGDIFLYPNLSDADDVRDYCRTLFV